MMHIMNSSQTLYPTTWCSNCGYKLAHCHKLYMAQPTNHVLQPNTQLFCVSIALPGCALCTTLQPCIPAIIAPKLLGQYGQTLFWYMACTWIYIMHYQNLFITLQLTLILTLTLIGHSHNHNHHYCAVTVTT